MSRNSTTWTSWQRQLEVLMEQHMLPNIVCVQELHLLKCRLVNAAVIGWVLGACQDWLDCSHPTDSNFR
eukprot:3018144-Amphidinium_carterae.2